MDMLQGSIWLLGITYILIITLALIFSGRMIYRLRNTIKVQEDLLMVQERFIEVTTERKHSVLDEARKDINEKDSSKWYY